MGKSKKRTIMTFITMTVVAIAVLAFYYYWSIRTDSPKELVNKNISEIQKLLNKDLELYYPETPREVVKLYSSMIKNLYSGITDEEVEGLALKMRELYDDELLLNNPEYEYMRNLYSEIAEFNQAGRKITNYLFNDNSNNKNDVIEGREYATMHISYSIQEKFKHNENWRFLLRKSDDGKWKILGWEVISDIIVVE